MQTNVRLEHQLLAVEAEHRVHCMLELVAPPAPKGEPRKPFHLALVIDRSGSMAGRKLEVTRECASFLVQRLADTDELALITYDDEVSLLSPLMPVDRTRLGLAIGGIFPGGTTNLSGGWMKGLEALQRVTGEGPRKILLLTDGLANVGVTDPAALVELARTAATSEVGTTTIGFGDDFDEDLLTAMANAGRGNAHYAPTPDAAPGIFAEELEGLMGLVAQNVSVEIRPSEPVQVLAILNEYPQVPVPGGVQVQLGDAYGDERRRIVFELQIPELAVLGPSAVAEIVLRYVTLGEQIEAHEVTIPLSVNLVSADEAAAVGPDREVVEEVVILKAARAQDQARELAGNGEFDQARSLLSAAATELRRLAPDSAQAAELTERAEDLEANVERMSAPIFDALTAKTMRYQSRRSAQRRRPKDEP